MIVDGTNYSKSVRQKDAQATQQAYYWQLEAAREASTGSTIKRI
jgi:hypothetical protein